MFKCVVVPYLGDGLPLYVSFAEGWEAALKRAGFPPEEIPSRRPSGSLPYGELRYSVEETCKEQPAALAISALREVTREITEPRSYAMADLMIDCSAIAEQPFSPFTWWVNIDGGGTHLFLDSWETETYKLSDKEEILRKTYSLRGTARYRWEGLTLTREIELEE